MNFVSSIKSIGRVKKYLIDDFKGNSVKSIDDLDYDYDFYKNQFGNLFDDEILALFELIENSDLNKKEIKLMSLMLKKMYEEKYKDVKHMIKLEAHHIDNNLNKFELCEHIKTVEDVEDVEPIKKVEYAKQLEFNESNYIGFDDIILKIEELEL